MKNTRDKISGYASAGLFGIDTLIVLFFLALEYGRAVTMFSIDGLLMGTTMAMVAVLPYFLPSRYQSPGFGSWLVCRGSVAFAGILLGFAFKHSLGVILPESLRMMPLTLLILASMISCYIQFYGLMRLRLAK